MGFRLIMLLAGFLLCGVAIWRLLSTRMVEEEKRHGSEAKWAEAVDVLTTGRLARGAFRSLLHSFKNARAILVWWILLIIGLCFAFTGIFG